MRRCVFAATVCTFAVIAAVAAQQPTVRQTFRSSREILTIEVAVRGADGTLLTDLKPSDFTVKIDGHPRSVVGAELFDSRQSSPEVAVDAAAPRPAAVTRNTDRPQGRIVVFAVDLMSIRGGGERAAVETASRLVAHLTPADAVAAIGIPGAVTDLSRDHAKAIDAIRHMTGTAVAIPDTAPMSWEKALEREPECQRATVGAAACAAVMQLLMQGRAQAVTTLTNIESVVDRLAPLRAPKSLVILSGGIPFDQTLVDRFRAMAQRAARSHTTLFIIHLDQQAFDASSTRMPGGMAAFGQGGFPPEFFGGRDYETGLATVATLTGGEFFFGVGPAQGPFDRIAAELTSFYQLGVESTAADADGKTHRVEVTVSRPGAKVRAPTETAVPSRKARTAVDVLKAALAEPTDVVDLPLEVETYVTHSKDPSKVRIVVSAGTADPAAPPPSLWGSVVLDGNKVLGAVGTAVEPGAATPWSTNGAIEVAPGRYRLRTAISAGDRAGTLEVPLVVGLRAMGDARASDLMVGLATNGRLDPASRVSTDDHATALIELSSDKALSDLAGAVLLTAAGGDTIVARQPLTFQPRGDDKSVVVGQARLDLSHMAPGRYTASAIVEQAGKPIGRVSRAFEVTASGFTTSATIK